MKESYKVTPIFKPSDYQVDRVVRCRYVINRINEINTNWKEMGTHMVGKLENGELLINKTFVDKCKKIGFAAYMDVVESLK